MNRDIIRRALALFSVSALIAVLIILIVYSKLNFGVGVRCPFKEIFDIDCPGCGGTRMAVALLNLDFYQAFRYNPFVCTTFPILAVIYIWQSYLFIFKNKLLSWLDYFLVIYAVLLLAFGILRNTNIAIFSWMAPTVV